MAVRREKVRLVATYDDSLSTARHDLLALRNDLLALRNQNQINMARAAAPLLWEGDQA